MLSKGQKQLNEMNFIEGHKNILLIEGRPYLPEN